MSGAKQDKRQETKDKHIIDIQGEDRRQKQGVLDLST